MCLKWYYLQCCSCQSGVSASQGWVLWHLTEHRLTGGLQFNERARERWKTRESCLGSGSDSEINILTHQTHCWKLINSTVFPQTKRKYAWLLSHIPSVPFPSAYHHLSITIISAILALISIRAEAVSYGWSQTTARVTWSNWPVWLRSGRVTST